MKPCEKCKPLFEAVDKATARLINTLGWAVAGLFVVTAVLFYHFGSQGGKG